MLNFLLYDLMHFDIKELTVVPFCFLFNWGYDAFSQAFDLVQGALVSLCIPFTLHGPCTQILSSLFMYLDCLSMENMII